MQDELANVLGTRQSSQSQADLSPTDCAPGAVVILLQRDLGPGTTLGPRVKGVTVKDSKKKFHLAQFLVHGPTYHSLAMWRHPRTDWPDDSWRKPELYQHIAKFRERGRFEIAVFADPVPTERSAA